MSDIDISAVTRRKTFSGSAGVGPYACTFEITDEEDIAVYKDTTLLTLTTDYTVSIAGNGTFSVTLLVAATGSNIVTVIGAKPIARSSEFSTGGDFFAATVNAELDALVIFDQQLLDRTERALKAHFSDDITLDMTLPPTAERAGNFLSFDSNGEPIAAAGVLDEVTVSAFMETVLDDDDAATARATLGSTSVGDAVFIAASAAAARSALGAIGDAIVDAKGDLIVGTAADTPARKAVGTDGYPLVPLAAASDGLAYLAPSAGTALVGGYLAWSVAATALTVAVKTWAGNDPSTTEPVYAPVRSATASTGLPAYRAITAAASVTVPDTATLGTSNSVAFRLWAVLFDDGGTARLGVINCRSSTTTYPLAAWQIASSTAVGTGSDAALVFYTGSGVTSKGYAVLGYATWESGLATAGTWSAGPTRVQAFGHGVPLPGQVVQSSVSSLAGGTVTNSSYTDVPNSTASITPTSAANFVDADYTARWLTNPSSTGTGYTAFMQMLRGSTVMLADQVSQSSATAGAATQHYGTARLLWRDFPASTSSVSYKLQEKDSQAYADQIEKIICRLDEVMA